SPMLTAIGATLPMGRAQGGSMEPREGRRVGAPVSRDPSHRTGLVGRTSGSSVQAVGKGVEDVARRCRSRMTDTDSFDCRAGSQFHHGGGSGRLHACASLLAISLTEWLPAGVALS